MPPSEPLDPIPRRSDVPLGAVMFATTHWTVILTAKDVSQPEAQEALARLCQTYWAPLYSYLRRDGHSSHDAEDLVQAFFERFLEKNFLKDVERERGRFRSFLLVALRHFIFNENRASKRLRRGGQLLRISLDVPEEELRCQSEMAHAGTPEKAYDRRWAQTIMGNARRRLRDEMTASRKSRNYEILQQWLATDPSPGEYEAAAPDLNLSPRSVGVAVFRLRQRFRELVRIEVADTVAEMDDVQEEMRYLLEVITQ